MNDWKAFRSEFPALSRRTYLNTAGGGPLSRRASAALRRYSDELHEDGDVHWTEWVERVEIARRRVARTLKAQAEEIAFLSNASQGLNQMADLLPDLPVISASDEFPSVTLPWVHRGRDIHWLDTNALGHLDIGQLQHYLDELAGPAILALSLVQYQTGFRLDMAALSRLREVHPVKIVVDASQGFGVVPIDLSRTPVDALTFSAYKWMNAGYGIAPLYVNRALLARYPLPNVGWRSAEEPYGMDNRFPAITREARGFEMGHPPFAGVFALDANLETLETIGIQTVQEHVHELVDHLIVRLDALGIPVISPRTRAHRAGIVIVRVPQPADVVEQLKKRSIFVSNRGGLRISIHAYNSTEDISKLCTALEEIL